MTRWYSGPGGMHWWAFGLAGMLTLAFWVAASGLAIWARHFAPRADSESTAVSILQEWFAKGEMDRPEFEERKALFGGR